MDCRSFRQNHVAFVDGMMSEWQTGEMYGHLERCEYCSRLDTVIRRGLLVARNLPSIQPSRDFTLRLEARLRGDSVRPVPVGRGRVVARIGITAAVLAAMSGVALGLSQRHRATTTADTGATTTAAQDSHVAMPAGAMLSATIAPEYPAWASAPVLGRETPVPGAATFQGASFSP